MFDLMMLILVIAYFIAVIGSMFFLTYALIRDFKKRQRPKFKLVKNDEDR